jgi:hypothetical protein
MERWKNEAANLAVYPRYLSVGGPRLLLKETTLNICEASLKYCVNTMQAICSRAAALGLRRASTASPGAKYTVVMMRHGLVAG